MLIPSVFVCNLAIIYRAGLCVWHHLQMSPVTSGRGSTSLGTSSHCIELQNDDSEWGEVSSGGSAWYLSVYSPSSVTNAHSHTHTHTQTETVPHTRALELLSWPIKPLHTHTTISNAVIFDYVVSQRVPLSLQSTLTDKQQQQQCEASLTSDKPSKGKAKTDVKAKVNHSSNSCEREGEGDKQREAQKEAGRQKNTAKLFSF